MRAAVVTDFHSPLQIQDLPVPEPAPGQVLVRIEATGLSHTDIHAAHGDWPIDTALLASGRARHTLVGPVTAGALPMILAVPGAGGARHFVGAFVHHAVHGVQS